MAIYCCWATCRWFHPDILANPADIFIRSDTLYLIGTGIFYPHLLRHRPSTWGIGGSLTSLPWLLPSQRKVWFHKSKRARIFRLNPIIEFYQLANFSPLCFTLRMEGRCLSMGLKRYSFGVNERILVRLSVREISNSRWDVNFLCGLLFTNKWTLGTMLHQHPQRL